MGIDIKLKTNNLELINFLECRYLAFFNKQSYVNNYTIAGDWGTGKTELLKKLEKLKLNRKKLPIKFIWINLWEYELLNEHDIFIKIISEILKEIQKEISDKNKLKEFIKNSKEFIKKIVSTFSWTLSFSLGFLKFGINGNDVKKAFKKEQDFKSEIIHLVNQFEKLINTINQKIIIIFDDLDRCQENKILNILTTIKTFFFKTKSQNIFYFTALNEKYVNDILRCQNNGEKYTEKIFLKENKLTINQLIQYDSDIALANIKQQILQLDNQKIEIIFRKLLTIIKIINLKFKSILNLNFREIKSKLDFVYTINFLKKIENEDESGIIDHIFLGFFQREHFLQWKNFQNKLVENGFKFMEKIIANKLMVKDNLLTKYENLSEIDRKKMIIFHSLTTNIADSTYYLKQEFPTILLGGLDTGILNIYNFIIFLDNKFDAEKLWSEVETEDFGRKKTYGISYDVFKKYLNPYFQIYIDVKFELLKNKKLLKNIQESDLDLTTKILKSNGSY